VWSANHTATSVEQTIIPEVYDMDQSKITVYTAYESFVFLLQGQNTEKRR
jgi:hypothetical protein